MTKEELDKIHLCKNCKNKQMGRNWHYCRHSSGDDAEYECNSDVKQIQSNYKLHYPDIEFVRYTICGDGTFPAVKKCKFYEKEELNADTDLS